MKTRTVSDPDFNNDFFRNNPYVVTPDKLTQTSLVRQSRVSNFRISYYDICAYGEDDVRISIDCSLEDLLADDWIVKEEQ